MQLLAKDKNNRENFWKMDITKILINRKIWFNTVEKFYNKGLLIYDVHKEVQAIGSVMRFWAVLQMFGDSVLGRRNFLSLWSSICPISFTFFVDIINKWGALFGQNTFLLAASASEKIIQIILETIMASSIEIMIIEKSVMRLLATILQ